VVYRLQVRVRYADCDLQGVVFNANYLVYVDDVIEQWLTTALPAGELDYMVKKATLEWSSPATRGDLLDLTASVSRWGRTSYDVTVRGEVAGREVFTAVMTCINVAPGTHTPTPVPEIVRAALTAQPAPHPVPPGAPGVSCVFVCHDGRGRVLLARRAAGARDEPGTWDTGAGAIEYGESFEEAVAREVREEYRTEVRKLATLGVRNVLRDEHVRSEGGRRPPTPSPIEPDSSAVSHWVAVVFAVEVDPNPVAIGEPHKFDRIGWYSPDTPPEPAHSQLAETLALFRAANP
jgi:YbgC/YbaW family acyl-CoA thioester hydrolase